MFTATLPTVDTPHEVISAFDSIGLPLNKKLEAMLNEAPEHQRPRRGCGFTQASRFLAELINQPRGLCSDADLRLFSDVGQKQVNKVVALARNLSGREPNGLSDLHLILSENADNEGFAIEYLDQITQLENLVLRLEYEESRLIVNLMLSILGKKSSATDCLDLKLHREHLAIGTCPEAERYFLEFSGGYVRRQGIINIFYDEFQRPAIIEKINIGDSHSCLTVRNMRLNGVLVPAGSLLGTNYKYLPIDTQTCTDLKGGWMPVSVSDGFKFLRLSTLSVSPDNRARAFNAHLKMQLEGSPFFDPLNTTLLDILQVAQEHKPNIQFCEN